MAQAAHKQFSLIQPTSDAPPTRRRRKKSTTSPTTTTVTAAGRAPRPHTSSVDPGTTNTALRLVAIAAEMAFGQRPLKHLNEKRFSKTAQRSIASVRKSNRSRGPVIVRTFHCVAIDCAANTLVIECCGRLQLPGLETGFAASITDTDGELCLMALRIF